VVEQGIAKEAAGVVGELLGGVVEPGAQVREIVGFLVTNGDREVAGDVGGDLRSSMRSSDTAAA
jgi:hypothetical protein